MRIDNIQTSQEVVSNNKVQPKEEFSDVLEQAITKEDAEAKDDKITKEDTISEHHKDGEEQDTHMDIFESLGGVLNIVNLERRPQEIIVLDTVISADQAKNISQDVATLSIDTFNATEVSQGNVFGEGEVVQENFVETLEQQATLVSDKPTKADLEVLTKPMDSEKDLEPQKYVDLSSVSTDKNTISSDKNTVSDKSINDETLVLSDKPSKEAIKNMDNVDIEKPNVELEAKEEPVFKGKEDISIIAGTQIKDTPKIDFQTKTVALESKLSNENLSKVDQSILELVEITKEGDTNILKVKVYPENLGTVDVVLKMQEGKLIAKILVDNDYVKGLFVGKINELNEGLIKQNIHLEKIDIDLNLNSNMESNSGFSKEQKESFNQRANLYREDQARYRSQNNISEIVNEAYIYNKGSISILA